MKSKLEVFHYTDENRDDEGWKNGQTLREENFYIKCNFDNLGCCKDM